MTGPTTNEEWEIFNSQIKEDMKKLADEIKIAFEKADSADILQ